MVGGTESMTLVFTTSIKDINDSLPQKCAKKLIIRVEDRQTGQTEKDIKGVTKKYWRTILMTWYFSIVIKSEYNDTHMGDSDQS